MLMGLNLLSQPAQALDWKFSYTNDNGNSFTGTLISNGRFYATNTIYDLTGISGTVTNRGSSASVSTVVVFLGSVNEFVWDGTTGIALSVGGIGFSDSSNSYNLYNRNGSIFSDTPADFSSSGLGTVINNADTSGDLTISSLTPAAVPWETDALPVIGSTVLFGLGLWAKKKFAKPLLK